MKNNIWVSFNYGGWSLVFSKTIELPFAPFFGLGIITNDEKEHEVKLENNDYCRTVISWNLDKQQFEINVRHIWRNPVSDETVDSTLLEFSDWKRHDITDIQDLKDLMARDYKLQMRH